MFQSELSILAIYGLIVASALVLQTSGVMGQLGIGYILSSRDENRRASGMAARMERATNNSVVALSMVAPAVLIIAIKGNLDATSLASAQIFLIARVVYLPAYAFGIVGLRTLTWVIGFAATWFVLRRRNATPRRPRYHWRLGRRRHTSPSRPLRLFR